MRGPPAPLPHPPTTNHPTPPPASPPRLPEFVKVELATAVIVVFRKQPRRLLLIRVREAGDDALSPNRRSRGLGGAPSRRSAPLHWRRAAPSRRRRAWCRSRRASTVRRLQQRCSSGPLLSFQSGGSRDRHARERPSPAGVTLADLFAQRLVLARTTHKLLGINAARVVLVLSGHGGIRGRTREVRVPRRSMFESRPLASRLPGVRARQRRTARAKAALRSLPRILGAMMSIATLNSSKSLRNTSEGGR